MINTQIALLCSKIGQVQKSDPLHPVGVMILCEIETQKCHYRTCSIVTILVIAINYIDCVEWGPSTMRLERFEFGISYGIARVGDDARVFIAVEALQDS